MDVYEKYCPNTKFHLLLMRVLEVVWHVDANLVIVVFRKRYEKTLPILYGNLF